VHGGALFAAMDSVAGFVNWYAGTGGPTLFLEVAYKRAVPLNALVFFETSVRPEAPGSRTICVPLTVRLHAPGSSTAADNPVLCAATGMFLSLNSSYRALASKVKSKASENDNSSSSSNNTLAFPNFDMTDAFTVHTDAANPGTAWVNRLIRLSSNSTDKGSTLLLRETASVNSFEYEANQAQKRAQGFLGRDFVGASSKLRAEYFWHAAKRELYAVFQFTPLAMGARGACHGGAVAAAIDDAMQTYCWRHHAHYCVTAKLHVAYKKFTPLTPRLHTYLIRVRRASHVGRKVVFSAEVLSINSSSSSNNNNNEIASDVDFINALDTVSTVHARAEALFIQLPAFKVKQKTTQQQTAKL
jgi:acyl-coenzyme A thioesterase PaaI-like protein